MLVDSPHHPSHHSAHLSYCAPSSFFSLATDHSYEFWQLYGALRPRHSASLELLFHASCCDGRAVWNDFAPPSCATHSHPPVSRSCQMAGRPFHIVSPLHRYYAATSSVVVDRLALQLTCYMIIGAFVLSQTRNSTVLWENN